MSADLRGPGAAGVTGAPGRDSHPVSAPLPAADPPGGLPPGGSAGGNPDDDTSFALSLLPPVNRPTHADAIDLGDSGAPRAPALARNKHLILAMLDVALIPQEGGLFRRERQPEPGARQEQVRDMLRLLDPDMIVLHGVADAGWAADLGRALLPTFPNIAYRASTGSNRPGGGMAILSRHKFADTQFRALDPVSPGRLRGPDPGILLTTQDAGDLGRTRLAVLETGWISRRAGDEPRFARALREQVKTIVSTVMDPDCPHPTLLMGTPPVWPRRERAAWAALLSAGLVDGLMAGAPPARQGIYDPVAGGLPVQQRHHLFMRMGDFAHMFIDRVETVEGAAVISLDRGAWIHLHRRRPLRVTLSPRKR